MKIEIDYSNENSGTVSGGTGYFDLPVGALVVGGGNLFSLAYNNTRGADDDDDSNGVRRQSVWE